MKDAEQNIVPTNTIPIYIESTRRDGNNGKIYLESGPPSPCIELFISDGHSCLE